MNDYTTDEVERIEPDERDVRALEQYLTVLPRERGTYEVVSQSGKSYTVDDAVASCEQLPDDTVHDGFVLEVLASTFVSEHSTGFGAVG